MSALIPILYANAVSIGISNADLVLDLGVKGKGSPSPDLTPDEVTAVVRMSPHAFKAFVMAASEALRNYEGIFGELNLEPNQEALRKLTGDQSANNKGQ